MLFELTSNVLMMHCSIPFAIDTIDNNLCALFENFKLGNHVVYQVWQPQYSLSMSSTFLADKRNVQMVSFCMPCAIDNIYKITCLCMNILDL